MNSVLVKYEINRQFLQETNTNSAIVSSQFMLYVVKSLAIILISARTGFIFRSTQPTTTTKLLTGNHQPQTPDIAHGTDGAILTLSDGKQIILDNTGKGEIAQEGNARVIKSEDGQLVYQSFGQNHLSETRFHTVSIPCRNQYRLVLPDGSKVWLNAASSINYPAIFTGTDRAATITGEVCFEVVSEAKYSFKVLVLALIIEVLGTQFNVNAYEDENSINTTLVGDWIKLLSIRQHHEQQIEMSSFNARGRARPGAMNVITHADLVKAIA